MHLNPEKSVGVLLVAAVVLTAIFVFVNSPDDTLIWGIIFDGGHPLLFGLFAVLIWVLGGTLLPPTSRSPKYRLVLAFALSLLLGILVEILQGLTGGDAEFGDVLRDLAGITAFLLMVATFRNDGQTNHERITRKPRPFRLAAALIFLAAYAPAAPVLIAYARRDLALPVIFDFQPKWERSFLKENDCTAVSVLMPQAAGVGLMGGRVTFHPAMYPGIVVEEPYPDWSQWDSLEFSVYSELEQPVSIALRIDDVHHNGEHFDRFNRALEIRPGNNEIVINLAEARLLRWRELDLKRIRRIFLFAMNPERPFPLYFSSIKLTKNPHR